MGRATAMMGPAHSLSGAAAWLGVGAAAAATGHPMPWPVILVGALICAGAALAPDLDHKAATISRAFGPLSRGLCEIVDKLSYAVYKATRKQGDPRRSGGHRTLTHTWLWAVLIGAGTSAIVYVALVTTWFNRMRGFAIGIAMAGSGFSAIVMPKLMIPYVAEAGWRMGYQALAIICCQAANHAFHRFGAAVIERPERRLAFLRQSDIDLAAVSGRAFTRDVIGLGESFDNPA